MKLCITKNSKVLISTNRSLEIPKYDIFCEKSRDQKFFSLRETLCELNYLILNLYMMLLQLYGMLYVWNQSQITKDEK